MKAFEEWWENNNEFCHNKCGQFHKEDAIDAWKAALEWIRDNEDTYCCGDWDDSEGKYHGCLKMDAIKKELENE